MSTTVAIFGDFRCPRPAMQQSPAIVEEAASRWRFDPKKVKDPDYLCMFQAAVSNLAGQYELTPFVCTDEKLEFITHGMRDLQNAFFGTDAKKLPQNHGYKRRRGSSFAVPRT